MASKTGTILGKQVSALQTDVVFGNEGVTGTLLKQTEAFAGFDLTKGDHFLALQFSEIPDGATVKVGVDPTQGGGMVELDSDADAVLQLFTPAQYLVVETTVSGKTYTRKYALSKLVFA